MKVLRPNFEKRGGLVTVVTVDCWTKNVLMVAYTDESGFLETLKTAEAVYFSTSRKERWKKGETSRCTQSVVDVLIDCDGDAIIYVVEQRGSACHTGATTCFYESCIHGTRRIQQAGPYRDIPVRSSVETEVHSGLTDNSRVI